MPQQVNKNAYNFQKYCGLERMASYQNQLAEIIGLSPQNVLEVGVGDKVVANYIANNTNIRYTGLDIAADLRPDVLGDVLALPFDDSTFDVVCAFEVLEHLPWEKFDLALNQLFRVSRSSVLISLPHWGRHFSIDIRIPYVRRFRWQYKLNFIAIPHKFNGQHYWEIGKKGYDIKMIMNVIRNCNLVIDREYIQFDNPYHHFFVLHKQYK